VETVSIWSSLSGPDLTALDGHDDAANYRAEGEPTIEIDVATTGHHDHIRLALWGGDGVDVCAVLPPATAEALRDRLTEALERTRRPTNGLRT
jgi:hypothetical protein